MRTSHESIALSGASPPVTLRPRQQRFVDEYLTDFNATQAAIRAGHSAKTARQIGAENLSKPAIQDAIQAKQQVDVDRLRMTRQAVIQGILEGIDLAREQQRPEAMISGWKNLAQMLGFNHPERHIASIPLIDPTMAQLESMGDAELAAIVRGV